MASQEETKEVRQQQEEALEKLEEENQEEVGTTYPFTTQMLQPLPDLTSLSSFDSELIHKHRSLALHIAKLRDDPAWELKTQPSEKNQFLSVYFKPSETNESSWVCGEAECALSLSAIDETLSTQEKWSSFDKNIDKIILIKQLLDHFSIVQRINKGNFLMQARDFIMTHGRFELTSG